jgi:hypothetical protein
MTPKAYRRNTFRIRAQGETWSILDCLSAKMVMEVTEIDLGAQGKCK